MIGWITDNPLSSIVMESIPDIEVRHVRDFKEPDVSYMAHDHIFYGILRGCARAMHILKYIKADYYYIDNGYFDAMYVDKSMHKVMEGTFRVVKNDMHEVYPEGEDHCHHDSGRVLFIPPSPYSANFYDTTPEDWLAQFNTKGDVRVRDKSCVRPLGDDLDWCDTVVAFNSMVVVEAAGKGKATYDTHGIFRNAGNYPLGIVPVYDADKLRAYYGPKQFTIQEFREGKCRFI